MNMTKTRCIHTFQASVWLCVLLASSVQAQTARCNGQLISIGDSKSEVSKICGAAISVDNYCLEQAPIRGSSSGMVQPNCIPLEAWTLDTTPGQFHPVVVFKNGEVHEIKYGGRK